MDRDVALQLVSTLATLGAIAVKGAVDYWTAKAKADEVRASLEAHNREIGSQLAKIDKQTNGWSCMDKTGECRFRAPYGEQSRPPCDHSSPNHP